MSNTGISMIDINVETDIDCCRELWNKLIDPIVVSDEWGFRECFNTYFQREPFFLVAKENGEPVGLIPMCYISEKKYYGYFPGEVWEGKTWIEQNRIIAKNRQVAQTMFQWLDKEKIVYSLRYLIDNGQTIDESLIEDEIGYLFNPPSVNYDIEQYYSMFSRKSIKNILRDVDKMTERGLVVRQDCEEDYDYLVQFNLDRFAGSSYFADERFNKSFNQLKNWLKKNGFLKMTTITIAGEVAAVDLGCIYKGYYTLLAGGTNGLYPGVAKAINLFHLRQSCEKKYDSVDFLCGDFSWKKLFHLIPRPLFISSNFDVNVKTVEIGTQKHV